MEAPQPPFASSTAMDSRADIVRATRHSAASKPAWLGGPDPLGRRLLGEQAGEGRDQLLLLVAEPEVHGSGL